MYHITVLLYKQTNEQSHTNKHTQQKTHHNSVLLVQKIVMYLLEAAYEVQPLGVERGLAVGVNRSLVQEP